LSPATEYSARVQAMTRNGTGPSTAWTSASTFTYDLDGTQLGFLYLVTTVPMGMVLNSRVLDY